MADSPNFDNSWPTEKEPKTTIIPQSRNSRWVKRYWYTVPDSEGRQGIHGNMMGDGDFASDAWGKYLDID